MRQFAGTYLASIVPLVMPVREGEPAEVHNHDIEPVVGTFDVDADAEDSNLNVVPVVAPSIGCRIRVLAVLLLRVALYVITIEPSAAVMTTLVTFLVAAGCVTPLSNEAPFAAFSATAVLEAPANDKPSVTFARTV